jgi:hypothetical protein
MPFEEVTPDLGGVTGAFARRYSNAHLDRVYVIDVVHSDHKAGFAHVLDPFDAAPTRRALVHRERRQIGGRRFLGAGTETQQARKQEWEN